VESPVALRRRAIGEAAGTFALVFGGCSSVIANQRGHGVLGPVGVCLTFGLLVTMLVYLLGPVSGGHLNPAVSSGLALIGRLRPRDAVVYATSQCAGAIVAGLALRWSWPTLPADLGATVPAASGSVALAYEIGLTALLLVVVATATADPGLARSGVAVAIGATVTLGALIGTASTGGSMNPARSLGPALAAGQWQDWWVYLAGPLLGSALGTLASRYLHQLPSGSMTGEAGLTSTLSSDGSPPNTARGAACLALK
jgi:aquaporin NIP